MYKEGEKANQDGELANASRAQQLKRKKEIRIKT